MIPRCGDCIPTPLTERFHRARRSLLPVVWFCGSAVVALWLWGRQGQATHASGEVEAAQIDVTAGADGVLAELPRGPWVLFDRVEKNMLLARLDNRPVRAEMATLQADLTRLHSELTAAREQLAVDESGREQDYQRESRRLAWEVQKHRLDVLDRRALIETDRAEELKLETDLGFLLPRQSKGVVTDMAVADQRLLLEGVRKRIKENLRALAEAQEQLDYVTTAFRDRRGLRPTSYDKLLGPVETAITVGQRRLDEVQVRIEGLEVRSPISGTICAIHRWPGQNLRAGDPILTVTTEHGTQIVCYLRQEQRIRPAVGMPVTVRIRETSGRPVTSVVARVGPRVESVPLHHLRDPKTPEWGQPVGIQLPRELTLRPGELVDVTFRAVQRPSAM